MNMWAWIKDSGRKFFGSEARRQAAAMLTPYRAEEAVAATFRARQLQSVLRLAPAIMIANATNLVIIVSMYWDVANRAFLTTWALLTTWVVLRGIRAHWQSSRLPPRRTASRRSIRRATSNAAVLATLWSLPPLVLMPVSSGPPQLLLMATMTGMICAGGFALFTIPLAAIIFVLITGLSTIASLFRADFPLVWPGFSLLLIYIYIVNACVWSTARMFGARLMAEADAEHQTEVVGLLLRDFEENASDALWEVDAHGCFCRVSPKLAALVGVSIEALSGRPLLPLLRTMAASAEAADDEIDALERNFVSLTPFRDLPLAVRQGGRTRWWSLTAKPLHDAEGGAAGWRGVAADVTDAHQASRQLTWLAHFDLLTGLANRHQMRSRMAELLAPAAGAKPDFALFCLDLDHFKIVNDTLGHAVGDGLLREVACRLRQFCRPGDTIARLGGDEFAIVLPGVTATEEAERLAQALVDSLRPPCDVQESRIIARASIGVALAPRDGSDIDSLLNHADLALYAAKAAGRGSFRVFTAEMATDTRRRVRVEQALRGALARGEMRLAFQPQVDFGQWRVTGFEALLRWFHPELGEVSPVEFIPVAEDTHEMQEIGEWVMMQACREAARWPAGLTVSVNVSPTQVMTQDVCGIAKAALERSGLAAAQLEIEITESVFMQESNATMAILRSIREAGVRIALDDFGTGFSSLAYLRRFPFDTLKIDRSFVRDIGVRRDLRAIVKMIVGLAHTLGMRCVAEGVEDESQANVLRRYGCDTMQGFMVARPMPASAIDGFLEDWVGVPKPTGAETVHTGLLPLTEQLQ